MVADSSLKKELSISEIATKVAKELSHVEIFDDGARIRTPVLMPSGRQISIRINAMEPKFLVSDDGVGYREAELMGAESNFRRYASIVSQQTGVQFNSFEFFELEAELDNLPGIVAIVADASRMAVQLTAEKLIENLGFEETVQIIEVLRHAFGTNRVNSDVEIRGASNETWHFDALVKADRKDIAVLRVKPSRNSVSSAYVKLDDVRRLDDAPVGVAALVRRPEFSPEQIILLNRASVIMDLNSPLRDWQRLAA